MTEQRTSMMRWVALALLILGIGLMSLPGAETPNDPNSQLPDGVDSKQVAEILSQAQDDQSNVAIAIVHGESGDQVDLEALNEVARSVGSQAVPNQDGTAVIMPIQVVSQGLTDNVDKVKELRDTLKQNIPDGYVSQVTGPAAINADLSGVFEGANFMLLGVTAIIVAILLIVTYRSPVLWLIPLFIIGVADRVAAALYTYVLDGIGMVWNESTAGILSVLVFGAGTNYALLLISRYRDELRIHESRYQAMAAAWGPTAKTVSASAMTVVIGVACLVLSAVPTTRALGVASMVGIAVALFFAVFVLPGILVFFGRWIFWPKQPLVGEPASHGVWDRIGGLVGRKPAAVLIVSLAVLGLASIGATQMRTGLTQSEQFIDTPESIAAGDTLAEYFPGQSATPAEVLTHNAKATQTHLETVAKDQDKRVVIQPGEGAAGWSLLNVSGFDTESLRGALAASGNKEVSSSLVGGQDAQLYDQEASSSDDRKVIFPLVLGLVFLVLMVILRSLLAPVIMVASVLLTNVAALGLGWWISTLLGFEAFADTTPLYAFVFLVALGIDYTIFLVTRTKEEALRLGTKKGVLAALSSTGGVITSAGILLAAVFAALGVLPLVVLAQVGIVIFIGVLLDTLLVRTVLVPAVIQLLGEKFWWPARPATNTATAGAKS